jgi:outer membrane protein OmpA-like peptidoglycan-associated protein
MPRLDSAFDTARRTVPVAAPRGRGWLVPTLVGLAAVLLLGFWAARRRPVETVSTGTTVPADTTRAVPAGMVSETLPGGTTLTIPATGIESRLVTFIKDPAAKVSDTVWFDFDRLLFETGSATLKPESQDQLGLVAQILQAYPNVKARVGGYTDNVGNPSANVRLSQARATNVVQALEAKGVAAGRLDAKGYGAEHPVADNATEAGRAQNRRIALRVTAK